jgi:hypothetical protein
MIDPAQLLFNPADPRVSVFGPASRYYGLPVLMSVGPDGEVRAYVSRRFVPHPEDLAVAGEYLVGDGQRSDVIAAVVLGDPELFWRLCDGARALHPDEVEQAGRRLPVTLPAGIPGPARG